MTTLSSLLEQAAGSRMQQLPSLNPINPEPAPAPVMPQTTSPAPSGLESLLPMLAQQGGGGGPSAMGPGDSKNWEKVAEEIGARRYDYNPKEFNMLDSIIGRESSWDPTAVNPNVVNGKQAVGIPQHMVPVNQVDNWVNMDPRKQINWLYNYIENRYGTVQDALQFKNQNGWY